MHTDIDHAAGVDSQTALNGILALLVAEREQRADRGARRTERILAAVGLSDDQIAALTGHDVRGVRAIIESANQVPATPSWHSVIDRARAAAVERAAASARSEP
jgi:hypothetical protein